MPTKKSTCKHERIWELAELLDQEFLENKKKYVSVEKLTELKDLLMELHRTAPLELKDLAWRSWVIQDLAALTNLKSAEFVSPVEGSLIAKNALDSHTRHSVQHQNNRRAKEVFFSLYDARKQPKVSARKTIADLYDTYLQELKKLNITALQAALKKEDAEAYIVLKLQKWVSERKKATS